jgi:hypothetical protein
MGYDLDIVSPPASVPEHKTWWRESIWSMTHLRALFDELGMIAPRGDSKPDDELGAVPVPLERLSDNSGWLISEAQCGLLADKLHAALEQDRERIALVYRDDCIDEQWENDAIGTLAGTFDKAGWKSVRTTKPRALKSTDEMVTDLTVLLEFLRIAADHGGFRVY